jgi:hypothetical protein
MRIARNERHQAVKLDSTTIEPSGQVAAGDARQNASQTHGSSPGLPPPRLSSLLRSDAIRAAISPIAAAEMLRLPRTIAIQLYVSTGWLSRSSIAPIDKEWDDDEGNASGDERAGS